MLLRCATRLAGPTKLGRVRTRETSRPRRPSYRFAMPFVRLRLYRRSSQHRSAEMGPWLTIWQGVFYFTKAQGEVVDTAPGEYAHAVARESSRRNQESKASESLLRSPCCFHPAAGPAEEMQPIASAGTRWIGPASAGVIATTESGAPL